MITQMFGIGRTHFVDLLRMSNETKNEISGILLAGGKARRMGGVNKGAQLLGGRTLAGLVIERMKPQVKSIFISSNEFAAELISFDCSINLSAIFLLHFLNFKSNCRAFLRLCHKYIIVLCIQNLFTDTQPQSSSIGLSGKS